MAEASTTDDPTALPAPIAPVLFKARGKGKGKGKANMRKRSPSPPPAQDGDSDSDSDGSSDGGGARGAIRDTKRRRKNGAGVISASTEAPGRTSSGKADWQQPDFVTDRKTLLAESDSATKQEQKVDSGPTRAATGPAPTPGSSAMAGVPQRAVGPVKAPTNIRTITVTDYSPDVCKDYKQTGFCGFGDNCKFLHMREDYKQGWQLDNEWEAVTKGKKNLGGTIVASAANRGKANSKEDDDEEDEDEQLLRDIPFACIICRESYKQPIVTRCGHYFCERCALTRYRRDPSCAACGVATTGVFNTAKRLAKLLERKRQRAAKRRQAAIEAGEEPSSDEEAGDSD